MFITWKILTASFGKKNPFMYIQKLYVCGSTAYPFIDRKNDAVTADVQRHMLKRENPNSRYLAAFSFCSDKKKPL